MAEEKTEKVDKKKEVVAELVKVPSEYNLAFQLEDGSIIDSNELMIRIYNDIQKLKKGLL